MWDVEIELHALLAMFLDDRHWLASIFGYFISKGIAAPKSLHTRRGPQCLRGRPRDEISPLLKIETQLLDRLTLNVVTIY
jgi:2-keto-4-pentenoate hydratase/2-oxohepta-3-ene-1,7-dioic acid hydratase in catechol pathway